MIRIDVIWLALGASDLRRGIDALLTQALRGFALGAQAHHAYVFANRRADRLKVLAYDGTGMWLCTRRLRAGSFAWPREDSGSLKLGFGAAAARGDRCRCWRRARARPSAPMRGCTARPTSWPEGCLHRGRQTPAISLWNGAMWTQPDAGRGAHQRS